VRQYNEETHSNGFLSQNEEAHSHHNNLINKQIEEENQTNDSINEEDEEVSEDRPHKKTERIT
jgi:hypothetical protein